MWALLHSLEYITIFFIAPTLDILSYLADGILQYGLAWSGAARPAADNKAEFRRPDMSAHVFTWRIDSLVCIRGSYKLGGMLLFSDAAAPTKDDGRLLRAEIHFHPGDMGHRPIAFRNTLPFFPPRELDRRVIDSPICPPVAAISSDPWKNQDPRKRYDIHVSKIDNNCIFLLFTPIELSLVKSL